MNTKKLVLVLAVLMVTAIFFSGCGRIISKAVENAAEKAIEKDSGVKVDISGDSDTVSVKGEDGSEFQAGGDIKWPDKVPAQVPKLANVTYTLSSNDQGKNFVITFEKAEAKAIDSYIEKLIGAGFEETSKMEMEEGILNSYTKGNISVSITYTKDDKTGMVAISVNEE